MKIGLYDVDSKNFPNLPLMKISAYHKSLGDEVEFIEFVKHYDKVYVSKVFGDEYTSMNMTCINADEIIYGGTGFAITVEDGKEVKRIQEIGLDPDIRIYRKTSLPKRHILRDLQRWCNNRFIYRSQPDFWEYIPRSDGRKIKEIYIDEYKKEMKRC